MMYSLTKDPLDKLTNSHLLPDFTNAEMLVANFETDPVLAKEILPKPLCCLVLRKTMFPQQTRLKMGGANKS